MKEKTPRIYCPLVELRLGAVVRHDLVLMCRSVAGRCDACPAGLLLQGSRLVPRFPAPASPVGCRSCV